MISWVEADNPLKTLLYAAVSSLSFDIQKLLKAGCDGHPLLLQFLHCLCQLQRIPKDDSRDHQIESLRTSLLLGMGTILNPSVPIEKHSTCQGIARAGLRRR